MEAEQLEQFQTSLGSATSSSVMIGLWHSWWYRFWHVVHSISLFPFSWLNDLQMQQVQSFKLWKSISISMSASSTAIEVGEGVIEVEDILVPDPPLLAASNLGFLLTTPPPPGTSWLRSRFNRSRFFSAFPLGTVTGGVGILIGSPAFRCEMHSSNKFFNWVSDSLDLECNSLKFTKDEWNSEFSDVGFCLVKKTLPERPNEKRIKLHDRHLFLRWLQLNE